MADRLMTKSEFFKAAMTAGCLKEKDWILKAFSIVLPNDKTQDTPYVIKPVYVGPESNVRGSNVGYEFYGPDGETIILTDYVYDSKKPNPAFHLKEKITIVKGDIANMKEASMEVNYGNLLANWLLLALPFGDIIPYINGRFSYVKDIEPIIAKKLTSEPKDGVYLPGVMYVSMYNKYRAAASLIAGLSQLCVASATFKSMSTHPDMGKLKASLLEKNKDRLHDPVVVANMEAEMIALDAEWLKGDPSEGFLIGGKSRTVIRKKTFMWEGIEDAFTEGKGGVLVTSNLGEGKKLEDLHLAANNIREGAFDRGAETALGGDEVKKMLEVMQNSTISEDDCGTKLGFPTKMSKELADISIGQYVFEKNGTQTLLTDENIGKYIGKDVSIRTTYFCKTGKGNVCKACIGKTYAEHPTGIATAISGVGSTFMYIFMASMHAKALDLARFDYKQHIT